MGHILRGVLQTENQNSFWDWGPLKNSQTDKQTEEAKSFQNYSPTHRDDAVRGQGFSTGMTTDGRLFIGKLDSSAISIKAPLQNIRLDLVAKPNGVHYDLTLTACNKEGNLLSSIDRSGINADWLQGGVSLVCSNGKLQDTPDNRPVIDGSNWGLRPGTKMCQ